MNLAPTVLFLRNAILYLNPSSTNSIDILGGFYGQHEPNANLVC